MCIALARYYAIISFEICYINILYIPFMKKNIHPKLFLDAKVTDLSTGKSFTLASTKQELSVEVTNLSHPFYTGKQRIVDTENLVKKFESKRKSANTEKISNKREKMKKRASKVASINTKKTLTLKDMLQEYK
jgi:large subunit ribosomal protein L31